MEKKGSDKNYWPHFIVGSIIAVFGLCVWTVKEASSVPVQDDDFYFDSYYNVNLNINKIRAMQKIFDEKYVVTLAQDHLVLNQKNGIDLTIKTKEGEVVDNANITMIITRPTTNEFNKKPKLLGFSEGAYHFEKVMIDKIGRWQVKAKIIVDDNLTGFITKEINATQ